MGLFGNQASYGPPAEYTPRNQELEGQFQAFQDPNQGDSNAPLKAAVTDIAGRKYKHLDLYGESFNQIKDAQNQELSDFYGKMGTQPASSNLQELQTIKQKYEPYYQAHADAADQVDAKRTEVEALYKAGKISESRLNEWKSLTNQKLVEHLDKNKGVPNPSGLPLYDVPIEVNPHDAGMKALKAVATEVREYIDPQNWKEIEANPTALYNLSKLVKERSGIDIKEAVSTYLLNDPDFKASEKWNAAMSLKQIKDNPSAFLTTEDLERNNFDIEKASTEAVQKLNKNSNSYINQHILGKVDEISGSLAQTYGHKDVTYKNSIMSLPKWALGTSKDGNGDDFSIAKPNMVGEVDPGTLAGLDATTKSTGNLYIKGKFIGEVVDTKVNPKTKGIVWKTADGKEYSAQNEPTAQVTSLTEQQKTEKTRALQNQYSDVDAFVQKKYNGKATSQQFITALKNALRGGEGMSDYKYIAKIPEKLIDSKWIGSQIENLNVIGEGDQKITDEKTFGKLRNNKAWRLGIDGKFKATIDGKEYSADPPLEISGYLTDITNMYAKAQKVWSKPGAKSGQNVSYWEIGPNGAPTERVTTFKTVLNPTTGQYDLAASIPSGKFMLFDDFMKDQLQGAFEEIKKSKNNKLQDIETGEESSVGSVSQGSYGDVSTTEE